MAVTSENGGQAAKSERVCPHCGVDRYKAERADKREARMDATVRDRERLARENGLLVANAALARAEGEEVRRAMQRKIQRQARVIRRMEKKLLGFGQQPHAGIPPSETVCVSDIPEISDGR